MRLVAGRRRRHGLGSLGPIPAGQITLLSMRRSAGHRSRRDGSPADGDYGSSRRRASAIASVSGVVSFRTEASKISANVSPIPRTRRRATAGE